MTASRFPRSFCLGLVAFLLLNGCALMQEAPTSPQLYVLPETLGAGGGKAFDVTVKIAPVVVSSGLDTARIAIRAADSKLDYLADAAWPTSLSDMLQDRLIKELADSSLVRGVVGNDSGVQSDYILRLEVQDFEAVQTEDDAAPLTVRVKYRAMLSDARSRKLVATLLGQSDVEAQERTMKATIAAFGTANAAATAQIFHQLSGALQDKH